MRVVVQIRRVPVGKTPEGFVQAVWVKSRSEWCRHNINKRELVGVSTKPIGAIR